MSSPAYLNPAYLELLQLMFVIRLLAGPPLKKTILHKDEIAEVLASHEHIRQVQVISDLKKYHAPLWLPRRASDRKAFTRQRRPRRRNRVTLYGRPHWTGSPRPVAETRELLDVSPSIDAYENIRAICSEYGFPFLRARDIVCSWKPEPRRSRRKRPDHYLPDSEMARIRLTIGDHAGWSEGMRKGVLEVVLGKMCPREAATLTGEDPNILGQNARRVEEELAKREQSAASISG